MHRGYRVSGRVTRTDTAAGIHGLQVEVWAEAAPCDVCLRSALTSCDGSFRIAIADSQVPETVPHDAVVYVKVRDRDCHVIHDTRATTSRCDAGRELVLDIALAPEVLWWHLSRPLSWQPPSGPLVPAEVIDEIREAIGLLEPPGTPGHQAQLRAALCSIPPIARSTISCTDAWSTLQRRPRRDRPCTRRAASAVCPRTVRLLQTPAARHEQTCALRGLRRGAEQKCSRL